MSIVIPAYNAEPYLGATLDSVIRQTFVEWELVVSDDGSTDGTSKVAERYAMADPRIRLVHGPNGGVARARNQGLAATDPRTELVILLDSDDIWEPTALESLVRGVDQNAECVAVHALAYCIDSRGRPVVGDDLTERMRERKGYGNRGIRSLRPDEPTTFAELVVQNWIVTPGLLLMRRAIVERVGDFDPAVDPGDDWDFAIRLSRYGDIAFIDRPLLQWRRHGTSLTNSSPRWRRAHYGVRSKMLRDPANTREQERLARSAHVAESTGTLHSAVGLLRTRDYRGAVREVGRAGYSYVRYVGAVGQALIARLRRPPL